MKSNKRELKKMSADELAARLSSLILTSLKEKHPKTCQCKGCILVEVLNVRPILFSGIPSALVH